MTLDEGCAERGCPMHDSRETKGVVFIRKEWVGLTRDEQGFVYDSLHNATSRKDSFWVDFATAIEDKLKEKNT